MAIWQVYKNNAWVDMPDPSKLSINSEDLDVDSLRPIDALMLLNKWKKEADN